MKWKHLKYTGLHSTTFLDNEEMEKIMKIINYFNQYCISLKRVGRLIGIEAKQKCGFFKKLLGILGTSL